MSYLCLLFNFVKLHELMYNVPSLVVVVSCSSSCSSLNVFITPICRSDNGVKL